MGRWRSSVSVLHERRVLAMNASAAILAVAACLAICYGSASSTTLKDQTGHKEQKAETETWTALPGKMIKRGRQENDRKMYRDAVQYETEEDTRGDSLNMSADSLALSRELCVIFQELPPVLAKLSAISIDSSAVTKESSAVLTESSFMPTESSFISTHSSAMSKDSSAVPIDSSVVSTKSSFAPVEPPVIFTPGQEKLLQALALVEGMRALAGRYGEKCPSSASKQTIREFLTLMKELRCLVEKGRRATIRSLVSHVGPENKRLTSLRNLAWGIPSDSQAIDDLLKQVREYGELRRITRSAEEYALSFFWRGTTPCICLSAEDISFLRDGAFLAEVKSEELVSAMAVLASKATRRFAGVEEPACLLCSLDDEKDAQVALCDRELVGTAEEVKLKIRQEAIKISQRSRSLAVAYRLADEAKELANQYCVVRWTGALKREADGLVQAELELRDLIFGLIGDFEDLLRARRDSEEETSSATLDYRLDLDSRRVALDVTRSSLHRVSEAYIETYETIGPMMPARNPTGNFGRHWLDIFDRLNSIGTNGAVLTGLTS